MLKIIFSGTILAMALFDISASDTYVVHSPTARQKIDTESDFRIPSSQRRFGGEGEGGGGHFFVFVSPHRILHILSPYTPDEDL